MQGDVSFTFLHRVEEVELNIADGRWQSALALALTLPDICGGIAFPEIVKRYRDGRIMTECQKNPACDMTYTNGSVKNPGKLTMLTMPISPSILGDSVKNYLLQGRIAIQYIILFLLVLTIVYLVSLLRKKEISSICGTFR